MTAEFRELSKVAFYNGLWCVFILSAAMGRWIVQGEHRTRKAAEQDRSDWL